MQLITLPTDAPHMPTLGEFAAQWVLDMEPQWKASYRETVACTLRLWIVPTFGHWPLDRIDRASLMAYRAAVSAHPRKPSAARVNKIMMILGALLGEAGRRHGLADPLEDVKPLRERHRDIQPFSLDEVNRILLHATPDWRDYYTVRFFTGMRTGEIDGLQWKYVDWTRRQVLIRETIVKSEPDTPKTVQSTREIDMVPAVHDALVRQHRRTGERDGFVFCARNGQPLRHGNVRRRVWLPLLADAGLAPRRPYETRHTYATLMLAAGENPEYIRRQMGHANAEMLFSVYSRYVPNLTRRDGSAFTTLLGGTGHGTPEGEG